MRRGGRGLRSGYLRADSLGEKVESWGSKSRIIGEGGRETIEKWIDGGRFVTSLPISEARNLRIEKSLSRGGIMR